MNPTPGSPDPTGTTRDSEATPRHEQQPGGSHEQARGLLNDPRTQRGLSDLDSGHVHAHSPHDLAAPDPGGADRPDRPDTLPPGPMGGPPVLLHMTDTFASGWGELDLDDRVRASVVMGGVQREPRHPAYRVTPLPDSPVKVAYLSPHLPAAFTMSNEGVGGYGIVWVALLT